VGDGLHGWPARDQTYLGNVAADHQCAGAMNSLIQRLLPVLTSLAAFAFVAAPHAANIIHTAGSNWN
jgi:hypothetical protein